MGIIYVWELTFLTVKKERYMSWGMDLRSKEMTHMIVAYDPTKYEEYPIGISGQCNAFDMLGTIISNGHKLLQVYNLSTNFLGQLEFDQVIHI